MRLVFYACLAIAVAACSDNQLPDSERLTITAQGSPTLAVGQTTNLEAKVVDVTSGAAQAVMASWSTSQDGVVALSANGLIEAVLAIGSGSILVTAAYQGSAVDVAIVVTP